jgi:hypothetical protein
MIGIFPLYSPSERTECFPLYSPSREDKVDEKIDYFKIYHIEP